MSEHRRIPFWMIWANPIVRRYARSRLRPVAFGVWALLTLMIAGFIFFSARGASSTYADMQFVDAARAPIIPLLIFQGIILFILATGQVAGAMTAEADEDVLDYQRLAPMTPLAKVFGYLLGLPVREWALFALTMPFSVISMVQGEVPLRIGVQLYAVFLVAGVLYHLTGQLAGTVMKNRRWAFLSSMGLVFMLYTVIPQVANFGLVYFKYFTIMPVVEESFPFLIERKAGALVETYQNLVPTARFFGLNFPQSAFTLLSQGVLIVTMVGMLWRRWRRTEAHLLGKLGAVLLYGWTQLVFLGNSLPLINSGDLFPSREITKRFGQFDRTMSSSWEPVPGEALMMIGVYGLVSLGFLWMMTTLITPNLDTQIRGWRRARKDGRRSLPIGSDATCATPWVLMMVGMGAFGWLTFITQLLGSRWFPGYDPSQWTFVAVAAVLFTAGVGFHSMHESRGKRGLGLASIIVGLAPLLLGTVAAVSSDRLATAATWILGISPISWPAYSAAIIFPIDDMPTAVALSAPNAFWFWQGLGFLIVLRLLFDLRKSRKRVAQQTLESE